MFVGAEGRLAIGQLANTVITTTAVATILLITPDAVTSRPSTLSGCGGRDDLLMSLGFGSLATKRAKACRSKGVITSVGNRATAKANRSNAATTGLSDKF